MSSARSVNRACRLALARWALGLAAALTLGVVLFPLSAQAAAAALAGDDLRELNREAEQLFRQANEAAAADRQKALDLYQKALLRFERLVREGGIENGKLYYNVGNCHFRMNDLGRAILNYRRAQLYRPNDPNLHQNLEYARSRRLDKIETPPQARLRRTLLFWHYDFSSELRRGLLGISFVALWICAAILLFRKRTFLKWTLAGCALLAAAMFASLLADDLHQRHTHPGVITQAEVVARKGDSETYEPSFREPLHSGTEFNLVEQRGTWYHIELLDNRRCWIPVAGAELVRPP